MQEITIRVRDRRAKHQFSVHNRIIDQWYPIIGSTGLTLYSLYVRFANFEDERSYPGYTLIQKHLGLGRSTISEYNKLLELCGLIQIVPGDNVRTNDYYLLDIPEVTPETLRELASRVRGSFSVKSHSRQVFLRRIRDWIPLPAHFKSANQSAVAVYRQGGLAPEQGSPVSEQGSPVPEHPVRIQDWGSPPGGLEQSEYNNPKGTIRNQQSSSTAARNSTCSVDGVDNPFDDLEDKERFLGLLAEIGIADPGAQARVAASAIRRQYSVEELEALWQAIQKRNKTRKDVSNPAGLFMVMVESGQRAPGRDGDRSAANAWRRYIRRLDEQGILH